MAPVFHTMEPLANSIRVWMPPVLQEEYHDLVSITTYISRVSGLMVWPEVPGRYAVRRQSPNRFKELDARKNYLRLA
jgi:hypothetical protein